MDDFIIAYNSKNIQKAYLLADHYVKLNDKDTIDTMLIKAMDYDHIAQNLEFIKYLVEKCGANSIKIINEAAANATCENCIKYLIEQGATNITEILHNIFISDTNIMVYLIERGANFDDFHEAFIKELIVMGHGIIFNRDPRRLAYKVAEPYRIRHTAICDILPITRLNHNVLSIVLEYILYEWIENTELRNNISVVVSDDVILFPKLLETNDDFIGNDLCDEEPYEIDEPK